MGLLGIALWLLVLNENHLCVAVLHVVQVVVSQCLRDAVHDVRVQSTLATAGVEKLVELRLCQ